MAAPSAAERAKRSNAHHDDPVCLAVANAAEDVLEAGTLHVPAALVLVIVASDDLPPEIGRVAFDSFSPDGGKM
jgi:hypothetical protein